MYECRSDNSKIREGNMIWNRCEWRLRQASRERGCAGAGCAASAVLVLQWQDTHIVLYHALLTVKLETGHTVDQAPREARQDAAASARECDTIRYITSAQILYKYCSVQVPAPVRSSRFPYVHPRQQCRTKAPGGHRTGPGPHDRPTPTPTTPPAPYHSLLVGLTTTTPMSLQVEILGVRPAPDGRS